MNALTETNRKTESAAAPRAALGLALLLAMAGMAEAKQLALVVGNSDYVVLGDVKYAAEDAKAMAAALKRLDYDVTLLTDAGAADLDAALAAFATAAAAEGVDATLLYYAGHAFRFGGLNYLVPADSALATRAELPAQTRSLDAVIAAIAAPDSQSFVLLDTPLYNPLPAEVAGQDSGEGLAKVAAKKGMLIGYAAQPGALAAESPEKTPNSPFTTALLTHIEAPGISISDMMVLVRNDVVAASGEAQKPWDASALSAQYYFSPVYETSAALTAADYEMLADLDPETKAKLLALLNETGVSLEIEVLEEAEMQLASIEMSVQIEAVEDEAAVVVTPMMEIIALPEEGEEAAPAAGIVIGEMPGAAPALAEGALALPGLGGPEAPAADGAVSPSIVLAAPAPATGSIGLIATPDMSSAPAPAAPEPEALAEAPVAPGAEAGTTTAALTSAAPAGDSPIVIGSTAAPAAPASADADSFTLASVDSQAPAAAPVPEVAAPAEPELAEPELAEIEIPADIPRAVQKELARLGCYRSAVDGIWGKGSALSLVRYFSAKKTAPDTLNPTAELYVALKREENVVCKLTSTTAKIVAPASLAAAAASGGKKRIQTTTTAPDGQKKTIKRINSGVFR